MTETGNFKQALLEKLEKKEALIGILGLGYVGLPLAREFLKAGYKVLGFDVDKRRVEMVNAGESPIKHLENGFFQTFVKEKRTFSATTEFSRMAEPDALLVCVPTPLGNHMEPDLTMVLDATKSIAAALRPGQVVVLESSTFPGTTEEEMLPLLEKRGLALGREYFVGYSPEREDPGNKEFPTGKIPKVVSGVTPDCLEVIESLYKRIVKAVPVSNPRTAEMAKILENTYRAVNIALVNELKMLCLRMDIDIVEVIEAAKTKPFGFQAFYPGPGLGGHCIPIDPFYLTWKAKEYDFRTHFIELAGEVNTNQPYFVVSRAYTALESQGKIIKGSKILVLGVAYKKDIDDVRESPALKVYELLMKRGAKVDFNDPHIPEITLHRNGKGEVHRSVELTPEALKSYDLVVLITDHTLYRYDEILKQAPLILDTRHKFPNHQKVVRG